MVMAGELCSAFSPSFKRGVAGAFFASAFAEFAGAGFAAFALEFF